MSTILLVESRAFSVALTDALCKAGFRVQCEQDGGRAIGVAAGGEFDAAIIDAGPTDIGAHRVAQRLRARAPELPIFICTTYDEDTIARWAIEDRMLVLEKPIDEAQLVWLLQAQMGTLS
ncbi:response regulator [Steroidobacter sp. S1-65]|uniref:Response regulator n=1 Tax=Steroidobacter gossypii TaxID=2805490 RepID=A0ABS1WY93_9GAMM|nr:response regulator [Steroidobacter gossypii]MBM0105941.1 response regulator [Steroidobacter gossypii]